MNKKRRSKLKRLEVFLEFLIFGIIMGVVEDLIAIKLTTDATFSWKMIFIITLVAIPFAAIGELIVDRMDLIRTNNKKKKRR